MSTPNFPRMYRLNTTGAPTNTVPGVNSGRLGDFVLDDSGSLFYYTGLTWAQLNAGGSLFPPVDSNIVLQPSDNPAGNGYNLELLGGDATVAAGNGGNVEITGGSAVSGVGGNILITAGTGSTDAGNINITGIAGVVDGNGSPITLLAGNGNGTGAGGSVALISGSNSTGTGLDGDISLTAGTNSAGGDGGNVTIASGNGTLAPGNGGNITLNLGLGVLNQGEFRIRDAINTSEYLSVSQTAGFGLIQDNSAVAGGAAILTGTAGSFIIATGLDTFVLTNPKIFAGSLVFATVQTATIETLLSVVINPGLYTATFTFSGVLGADTTVGYMIVNPTSL